MDSYMPVKIISGKDCVLKKGSCIKSYGKKCLIVTGRNSALKSGALSDVKQLLESNCIEYRIFDKIEPNPETLTCKQAGECAREYGADFIFGVGGGSVLDASKAVAIFAANDIEYHADIYDRAVPAVHLPVILLGTTAGTGSEVTGVSVLTNSDTGIKKSISGPDCYADVSFCDYKYTMTATVATRITTALDAFCHAAEAFVAASANDLSETYSLKALSLLKNFILSDKLYGELPENEYESLYIASLYAGLAINIAGTCFPHTVGYYLTENHAVPHGKACAVLFPALLKKTKKYCPEKLEAILYCMNTDYEALVAAIKKLSVIDVKVSEAEIDEISHRWENGVKNFDRTPGGFSFEEASCALKELIC